MAEKLTAGICTSGSRVKLSALSAGKFHSVAKKTLNQEKVLFSMFDRLLGGCKARLADISTRCVITGPGRFTGLRVGLTLASVLKTLAGIRVYSSTLFDVLAAQAAASKEFRGWAAGKKEPRIVALVHAFKDEYFCQAFQVTRQGAPVPSHQLPAGSYKCEALEAPRWLKDIEIAGHLGAGRDLYVIADAEEKADIYSLVPAGFGKAPPRISRILPDFVIKTGLALKNRDLAPLYLKPAKYELDQKTRQAAKEL